MRLPVGVVGVSDQLAGGKLGRRELAVGVISVGCRASQRGHAGGQAQGIVSVDEARIDSSIWGKVAEIADQPVGGVGIGRIGAIAVDLSDESPRQIVGVRDDEVAVAVGDFAELARGRVSVVLREP